MVLAVAAIFGVIAAVMIPTPPAPVHNPAAGRLPQAEVAMRSGGDAHQGLRLGRAKNRGTDNVTRVSEHQQPDPGFWFGRRSDDTGLRPLTWQGRAATFLYAFLVIVAVLLYSQLSLIIVVVGLYTVVFGLVVAAKSDLISERQRKG